MTSFNLKIPKHHFKTNRKIITTKLCVPRSLVIGHKPLAVSIDYGRIKQGNARVLLKTVMIRFSKENQWRCTNVAKLFNEGIMRRLVFHEKSAKQPSKHIKNKTELPYLLVETEEEIKKRQHRHADCKRPGKSRCCRESLKISFAEIGLGHVIIAPTHFDAYLCKGQCGTYSMHISDRVEILKRYNSNIRSKKNGDPVSFCCSATRTRSLPVMFQDRGSFKMKEIKDLIIESCGCV